MSTTHGSHELRRRRHLLRVGGCALAALLACSTLVDPVAAAFTATTANGPSQLKAANSFPTYPQSVTADGPELYHRSDDAVRSLSAADTSGKARPGRYTTPVSGPSTWWRFNEGSGATVADSSGAANPGTQVDATSWTGAGRTGAAASFAAADPTKGVQSARPAVRTDESFSVSAWVYLTGAGDSHVTAVSQDGDLHSGFFLKSSGGNWEFMLPTDPLVTNPGYDVAGSPVSLNRWVHLVGVYDDPADRIRLYVDGSVGANGVTTRTVDWSATGRLQVGRGKYNGSYVDGWPGRVDDVRTYRRALTADEVSALYEAPVTRWEMDVVSGTTVADLAGGNPGRLDNGATPGTYGPGWTPDGHTGGGLGFDGADDHAVGAGPGVRTDRSFTVTAWANLALTSGTRAVASIPGTTSSGFLLKQEAGRWTFWMPRSDSTTPSADMATAATPAATNRWVHLAGVYDDDANEIRLYVDGVLSGTSARADTGEWLANGPLAVGRAKWNASFVDYWVGRLDGVRLYDRALSSRAVARLVTAPQAVLRFDEGSGTTAADSSGNGSGGTLSNGASWAAGHDGGSAASLDGTDDHVATAGPAVDTSQSFSVSAWVYLTSGGSFRTVLGQDGRNVSSFFLQYDPGLNAWAMSMLGSDDGGALKKHATSTAVALNTWTHLTGVYDDATDQLRIYVNGVRGTDATGVTTDWHGEGPLTVGRGKFNGAPVDHWAGRIDDVTVHGRALTDAEARSLYDGTPTLRWELDETSGTTTADASGSGRTGTLEGSGGATVNPQWTTGRFGNALAFDGTDDRVSAAGPAVRTGDASFTVSAWLYPTGGGARRTGVAQDGANVSAFSLESYYDASLGNRWAMVMPDADDPAAGVRRAVSGSAPTLNAWTHVVGVYDDAGDEVRLYVNGALAGTAPRTANWSAGGILALGRARTGSATLGQFWSGRVDAVRTYRQVLGTDEIRALYGGTTVPAVTTPAVVGLTAGVPGALQGPQQGQRWSTAVAFNGTGGAYNPHLFSNPQTFTVEAWFRTTSTTGGHIVGFNSSPTTPTSARYDRTLYLDSANRLSFHVYLGGNRVVRSDAAYNDGQWHHVAASAGPAGLKLYVDGKLVSHDPTVTTVEVYDGYWRWGGASLAGYDNRPATDYFSGTIDEVAVYPTQLTDQQVRWHFYANH